MKTYQSIIQKRVSEEYEKFRNDYLESEKEKIFDDCYKIHFFTEVKEFLCSNVLENFFSHDTLASIFRLGLNILECMYERFINDEFASVDSYDDIVNFINFHYK